MPQNAIIRSDGTGDYATLSAWAIAERTRTMVRLLDVT